MDFYPKAAMERAMKVQEVILRAMAKKITWWQAAEIIGISDRHMRRWRERYEEFGYDGLFDRRRGQPSPKRVALAVVEQVLGLYRDRYADLNVRHFHEKLREQHGIELSYSWMKQALQGAGLVARGRKRGVHRKRRARRPLPGMLLHIDGSRHRWFQDERWYDLIVILDDATSEIYYAQLVEEESTMTVMAGLKEVIERKGVFCALYSDRGSHFWRTPKVGGKVDPHRLTQVGRALRELGIQMIPAYSPQARGRSERNFGTWQGRLPQELRLAGITTLEAANAFLRAHYIAEFNRRFQVPAAQSGNAFLPRRKGQNCKMNMQDLAYGDRSRKKNLPPAQQIAHQTTTRFESSLGSQRFAFYSYQFTLQFPKPLRHGTCDARGVQSIGVNWGSTRVIGPQQFCKSR
jgi:transposase